MKCQVRRTSTCNCTGLPAVTARVCQCAIACASVLAQRELAAHDLVAGALRVLALRHERAAVRKGLRARERRKLGDAGCDVGRQRAPQRARDDGGLLRRHVPRRRDAHVGVDEEEHEDLAVAGARGVGEAEGRDAVLQRVGPREAEAFVRGDVPASLRVGGAVVE